MTAKENLQRIYAHQSFERFPDPEDMISVYMPGEHYLPQSEGDDVGPDWFGTYWSVMHDDLGGDTVIPGRYRLTEIADWKSESVIPTEAKFRSFNWDKYFDSCTEGKDYNTHFVRVVMTCGFFERLHMLLGFENAVCEMYDSPDEVKAFVNAMVDFKKMEVDYVLKYFHPDVVSFHDDYGMERQMFMSPEMWKEFFEPAVQEIVAYMHEKGLLVQFHSCGYIMDIVGNLVNCGVDALEIQDVNDLKKIKKDYGDKVVIVSGIDAVRQASKGKTHEEILNMAKDVYRELLKGDGFLPKFLVDVATAIKQES